MLSNMTILARQITHFLNLPNIFNVKVDFLILLCVLKKLGFSSQTCYTLISKIYNVFYHFTRFKKIIIIRERKMIFWLIWPNFFFFFFVNFTFKIMIDFLVSQQTSKNRKISAISWSRFLYSLCSKIYVGVNHCTQHLTFPLLPILQTEITLCGFAY